MGSKASWSIEDHTGDIAIGVRAGDLESLFDAATRALFAVILEIDTIEPRERVEVRVEGALDLDDLLVRFLAELLFLHDARDWLFCGAEIDGSVTASSVAATVVGERFDPARHVVARQVKAVTHHGLRLAREGEIWSARIVLDL